MTCTDWMKESGFCKRLKQARKKKRMVQEDVVKRMDGRISAGTLDAFETGVICPSIGRVVELARIYDCSIDWLCGMKKDGDN